MTRPKQSVVKEMRHLHPARQALQSGVGLALGVLAALGLGRYSVCGGPTEVDIRRDATVAAIERVMPSVVNIATSQLVRQYDDPYEVLRRRFYGLPITPDVKEKLYNIGSGVIIDEAGDEAYILTNFHVVNGANRVQVQLMDGRVYDAEQLVPTALKDLALLRIVRRPGERGFNPIRFAEDDDLLLGETVITVGNPFGLGGSVSRGILSSKNRRSGPEGGKLGFEDWLQTDADINPGNSGGPLVNLRGELIGVNVAVYNEGEGKGTGFAIPVKQISAYLSDYFSLEYTAGLHLGARIKGTPAPLIVRQVQPNGPAFQAGLRVGQQIVEVNDKPVASLVEFCNLVAARPDHTASITVLENGSRRTLQVKLQPLLELDRQLLARRLGLIAQPLTETQANSLQIRAKEGLLISEVEKESPAERAQLQAGMVLTAVENNVGVADLVNVANVLGNKKSGERVLLTVIVPRRVNGGYIPFQQSVTVPVR